MPRDLRKIRVFAFLLLVLLVCGGLLKTRTSAAGPGLASTGNDVQVIITTYEGGRLAGRVTVPAGSSAAFQTSDVSVAGAAPMRPATAGDIVLSQIYSNGGNPGSTY